MASVVAREAPIKRVLIIRHITDYRYDRSVHLNDQRLMLRPREGRHLKLIAQTLKVMPCAGIFFAEDVYGNEVATAVISNDGARFTIEAEAEVELSAEQWPVYRLDLTAMRYPFEYPTHDQAALGAWRGYEDVPQALHRWVRSFVTARSMDTLTLLQAINAGVHDQVTYEVRENEGTQSAVETLKRGVGSCRDLAVLFTDTLRCLGFGARLVSGYLVREGPEVAGNDHSSTTHAWAEVYLPGAGWVAFDPTNRQMGPYNLIPIAVGRDMAELVPVSGSYDGVAVTDMKVSITIRFKT